MSQPDLLDAYELFLPPPGSNLAWVSVGKLVIAYVGEGKVPEDRFQQCLTALGQPAITTVLAGSENARPSSLQRTAVSKVLAGKKIVVVVDANPITRGVITAIGWLGVPMTSFGWEQSLEAAAQASLGLGEVSAATTDALLWRLRRQSRARSAG